MEKKFTCIRCPIGCSLTVSEVDGKCVVSGNTCKRGETYGIDEYADPKRTVTTLVTLSDGRVMAVKTEKPIKKALIFDVLAEVSKLRPTEMKIGEIVLENIAGSGANLIVTGSPTGLNKNIK